MSNKYQPIETLQDIKRMMERSSRFISLSGWSGVSAGICALGGALVAHNRLEAFLTADNYNEYAAISLNIGLIVIAAVTFLAAFASAFFFTYLRTRRNGAKIWDSTVQRLFINTAIPMAAGGLFLLRTMELGHWELIAPGCLIFYGLALLNASRFTLGEIRYLGYCQLILGICNLWISYSGLYFWALGFGVLHIVYGILMWWKYERNAA